MWNWSTPWASLAAKAAYEQGEPWLREVKAYIAANRDLFRNHLAAHLPHARLVEPEGTYLLWVDFRAYGLSHDELTCRIVDKARLWLDDGSIFGPAGDGFQRFNIAWSSRNAHRCARTFGRCLP